MSEEMPMIYYYCGQRLEEMTKEELIEAVKHLGKIQEAYYARDAMHARARGRVEMIKRGEA